MELNILRKDLLAALKTTLAVIERRSNMPVLQNVLLTADDNRLTICGTDLVVYLREQVTAKIVQPGSVCVMADVFARFVDKASTDDVYMKLDGNNLVVKCGRGTVKLMTLPGEDFPNHPDTQKNRAHAHGRGGPGQAIKPHLTLC